MESAVLELPAEEQATEVLAFIEVRADNEEYLMLLFCL